MVGTRRAACDSKQNIIFSFYNFIGVLDSAKTEFKTLNLSILFS